ncbi:hypothetical protein NY2A_b788R [Paramecium bursaria Chlorella virus NY2A]|uniref:Uncharacterized protein b788R n=1 Tax=Paramecium bursaria Chlorella virus NY2A TaxID=46021 RepID=A7IXW3_PBCVN|nr:hypothetical protein NY2A_b788R [Paramecium bursaria Chlorella virus NY2A]ABT15187.1 hypothetical protein NY2A_b788R [Paramecium bursaria Chlorella virus NY2A]
MSASASDDAVHKTYRSKILDTCNSDVPLFRCVFECTFCFGFAADVQRKIILCVLYFQPFAIQHHLHFTEYSCHVIHTPPHDGQNVVVECIDAETFEVREKCCCDVWILRACSHLRLRHDTHVISPCLLVFLVSIANFDIEYFRKNIRRLRTDSITPCSGSLFGVVEVFTSEQMSEDKFWNVTFFDVVFFDGNRTTIIEYTHGCFVDTNLQYG